MGRNSTENKVRIFDDTCTYLPVATEAGQDALLTELQAKADLTETQPVSVATLPLPTGASTEAKQDSQIAAQLDQDQVDALTDAVNVVDYSHHERHSGSNFTLEASSTGTSLIIAFRVEPSQTKQPHLTLQWKSEESGVVTFYKGATWTAGTGTDQTPNNSNDTLHGTNTSILQGDASGAFVSDSVTIDPTGLNIGSARILYEEPVWSTNQAPAPPGSGQRNERILEVGETYALRILAANGGLWLHLDEYEHTNPFL